MSRGPGNIARLFTNLKNSFFVAKQTTKFIGSDQFGNQYFEKIGDADRNVRSQRFIKERPGASMQEIPDVPVEWEAWLRGRRNNPPTEEEIQRNHMKMMQTKMRAERLEGKFSQAAEEADAQVETTGVSHITETIVSNNPKKPFPTYNEFEDSPGQKYNREGNTVK